MPSRLSCPKFDAEKLLFETFFRNIAYFRQRSAQSECIFPFLYNLIFQLNTGDNQYVKFCRD